MKKCMIAIAVCSLLMLTACNKSTENVTETTTTAVSSETTTVTVTEAETTAQSDEETLSIEELENQIAAAESILENMKEEEAAQTEDAKFIEIDPFEGMYISNEGFDWNTESEDDIVYSCSDSCGILRKLYPDILENVRSYLRFEIYNTNHNEEEHMHMGIVGKTYSGDTLVVKAIFNDAEVKEKLNVVFTKDTIEFTAWDSEEEGKGKHLYWENGIATYSDNEPN